MTDTETTSPFVPGARVAIRLRTGGFREAKVAKVTKVGSHHGGHKNIILEGSSQQYWVSRTSDGWQATSTGTGWHHTHLVPWDERVDREIAQAAAKAAYDRRLLAVQVAVGKVRLTDSQIERIEAILAEEEAASG